MPSLQCVKRGRLFRSTRSQSVVFFRAGGDFRSATAFASASFIRTSPGDISAPASSQGGSPGYFAAKSHDWPQLLRGRSMFSMVGLR
jgi:hypothetical protein